MRYRVRGPLHSDIAHIATELRGFIAHTGPIRLAYLQMHGVAAHTIDVSDNGAAFFEETVLPKIGATGSFVEQRMALRQPKELKLTATLCPMTATSLPNLTEWAGVWSEVTYGPRRAMVRLRCLPEDAERLRALESKGWRVLRGWAAHSARLTKPVPFAPQFWPSRAGCAAAPAELPAEPPAAAPLAAAPMKSAVTALDVLARPETPHLLLGITSAGQGVRLTMRAMIIAVHDGGERQDAVITALLLRALKYDDKKSLGALVIAERSKVSPRALASVADRLRVIDMANPWESARIPWRSLPPEGLKLLLGGDLPSPLPEKLTDALRAVGRRNLATPVVEALTHEPAHDLVGTLESGGGVVLLVEPGATASLLASLLILNLSLARITRPLLICRPASLPMPAGLADRAVQFVFGDAPTAAVELRAAPDSWLAVFPDGQKLTLQENLAALVEEQGGGDYEALMNGLKGQGWTPEEAAALAAASGQLDGVPGLGWPDELDEADEGAAELPEADEAPEEVPAGLLAAEMALDVTRELPEAHETAMQRDGAGLGWPESIDDEGSVGVLTPGAAVGLGWPDELEEADEGAAELPEAQERHDELEEVDEGSVGVLTPGAAAGLGEADEAPVQLTDEELAPVAADESLDQQDASELSLLDDSDEAPWEPVIDFAVAPSFDVDAWAAALLDDDDLFRSRKPSRRRSTRRRGRVSFTPSAHTAASAGFVYQGTDDMLPLELVELAPVVAADELPEAQERPDELTPLGVDEGTDQGWPTDLGEADEELLELPDEELAPMMADEGVAELPEAQERPDELTPLGVDEGTDQGWPTDLGEADEELLELPDEELAPMMADEGVAELPEAQERPDELPDEELAPMMADEGADEGAAELPEAQEQPAERLASLVAQWRDGAGLPMLARELRRQQPALSLLEAMLMLKAAIHSEEVLAASAPASAKQADGLVTALRDLAAVEPSEPVAQDALRRWREGGQRRYVVRDLAGAHGIKEADARTVYDRVVFPRVISDLNGSAGEVVRFLREPGSEMQAELPPVVVDCAARLIGGNTSPHVGRARALVPVMREMLVALDEAWRV